MSETFEDVRSVDGRAGVCPACGQPIKPKGTRGGIQITLVATKYPEGSSKRIREPINSRAMSFCEPCSVQRWRRVFDALEDNA